MTNSKPNILLITCDQLRFDFINCGINDFMNTPAIDELARDGKLFTNAYSPNPVCIPARHNLLTGLGCRHHGFDDNYFGNASKPSPYKLPTFAQILSDGGYETIAIGKMHFQPERRMNGFDFFYNMNELPLTRQSDDYLMYLKQQGYGNLNSPHGVRTCLYMQPQQSIVPLELHGSHWVADKAIEYFEVTKNRLPFLMWAGFIHPHPPFDVPKEYVDMYRGKVKTPILNKTKLSKIALENITLACLENDEVITRVRELYASCVSFVDYNIARMIKSLKENNLYDNTMIIFTSDHGEMLGDLGTYQKFLPYDPSCKIPMIIKQPWQKEAHTIDHRFVDLNDILPTMLDVANLDYPDVYDLPGESLLIKDGVKNRKFQYAEHQHGSKRWCMIRDKQYKYVHHYGDDDELFDLINDPNETTNLLLLELNSNVLNLQTYYKQVLVAYEHRYGLLNTIKNNDFIKCKPYEIKKYYETNSPLFTKMITDQLERSQMNDYTQEILAAIKNEPTTNLSINHTTDILKLLGWPEDEIAHLLKQAKEQGN